MSYLEEFYEKLTRFPGKPRGIGTTVERNALTSVNNGDLWFNTDRNRMENFDGDVWLNSDLRKVRNQQGVTLSEGQPVRYIRSAGSEIDAQFADFADNRVLGVVVDGDLTNGGWFTVAVSGRYNVYSTYTVTRGQYIRPLGNGDTDSLDAPSTGNFGFALADNAVSGLTLCEILTVRK